MTSSAHGSEQAREAQDVRLVLDTIPTLAWAAHSDGSADFFNQCWLDYTGLSAEQARDWGWTAALHPDDLNGLLDYWRSVLAAGEEGQWTIKAAIDEAVQAPVLTTALHERFSSRGEADFANKLLSAMRYQFGGHLEKTDGKSKVA